MGNPNEFKQIIEIAAKNTGGINQLADCIGQKPNAISDAKAGRRGLPDDACEKLAEIAKVDFGDVIRARMRQRGTASCPFVLMLFVMAVMTIASNSVQANLSTAFGTQESEVRILSPRPAILRTSRSPAYIPPNSVTGS